jgi:hypothetical protein
MSAPQDSRPNSDIVSYNPPVLSLLSVSGLSSNSSSTSNIVKDSFSLSLVDDPSSGGAVLDGGGPAALGAESYISSSASAGGAVSDTFESSRNQSAGAERLALSVAPCVEVHVAFDADFGEDWIPVSLHVMQLDLVSSLSSSVYVVPSSSRALMRF